MSRPGGQSQQAHPVAAAAAAPTMPAAKQNLTIERGATYADTLTLYQSAPAPANTPVDLTGMDARMHLRADIADPAPLLELTLANARLAIPAPATGVIQRRISAADTAALAADAAVYDLELQSPDGTVTRVVQGRVTISAEVTR